MSAVEINMGKKIDEALVKGLTGGDRITARFLGKEFFEFAPQAKFFLAVNVYPEVSGADEGIYRRIKIIPFDLELPKEEIEKGLAGRLKEERSGILNWALAGFKRWYERGGFIEPVCVTEASADFRTQMDKIGNFLTEMVDRKKGVREPVRSLYDSYTAWAKAACLEPASKKEFGVLLGQQGIKQGKSGPVRFWKDVQVKAMPFDLTPYSPTGMKEVKIEDNKVQ